MFYTRNLKGESGLFVIPVVTLQGEDILKVMIEMSYCTSRFGRIIWHDLDRLSLLHVLPRDNLDGCVI